MSISPPVISAVIPVMNTERPEFRRAMDSLRRSGLADEIILVDDHSVSRETQEELQRQSELGARVMLSRGRRSMPMGRGTGIHAARGRYILNMDSDDRIRGRVRRDDLAPINLAETNAPWTPTLDLWDYINAPDAPQWGSIIRTDLACATVREGENREEDIAWGYRMAITAWRDDLPIRYPSGVRYHWNAPEGRDTETARDPLTTAAKDRLRDRHLRDAMEFTRVCAKDEAAIRLWHGRRKRERPWLETHPKPGARVDVHVLSYNRPAAWLREALASVLTEPCNVFLGVGGFPGSIGAARAWAFGLGEAEYVSFVDEDDIAIPGVMQRLVDLLDRNPEVVGVYTDLIHRYPNGYETAERKGAWTPVKQLLRAAEITHLKLMRRSAVVPYLEELAQWPTFEEYVLTGLMCERGPWLHVPLFGAIKRFTPTEGSSMRLVSDGLWHRAVKRVTRPIMDRKTAEEERRRA